jgi:voltage-dependent potassium channel beta subunit
MHYNKLGSSGLKVSALSYGSWVTFGNQLGVKEAKKLIHHAYDKGINFFDNAEVYASGQSETIMGKILKDFPRESLVVSTKLFWGGEGPNDVGLSWKHIVEGTKRSLKRLDLEYVDLMFCHRPDPETPLEETVRAMNHIIDQGYAFYWGTSEWSATTIKEAHKIARRLGLRGPTMEQPQYNLLVRDRVEREYKSLYEQFGMGTTIWSPLASGALSGKYLNNSKLDGSHPRHRWVSRYLESHYQETVRSLQKVAAKIDSTLAQLSIAWCLKNNNVSSVILGASNEGQLEENLKALAILRRIDENIMQEIETCLSPKS